MSEKATEREALEQHDQAPKRPAKPKAEVKQPEVHVKKATTKKAEPKPARPSLTATAKRHLEELAERIAAADKAKDERLAILKKEAERGVPTSELAAAAHLSIPRTRQLLAK